jgi:hypothetical protein
LAPSSLPAVAAAGFDNAINNATRIRYLNAVLNSANQKIEAKLAAVGALSQAAVDDLNAQKTAVQNALNDMISLHQTDASQLDADIQQLQASIQLLEQNEIMLAKALQQNDQIRARLDNLHKVLGVVSALAQATPFAGPVGSLVGVVGTAVPQLISSRCPCQLPLQCRARRWRSNG